ncbi:MAG TPA: hypothetical protein VKA04_04915, partial [Pseudodesulfovibrio sp.]|nr:hypothetical protein [Pseudodesulfovibrio sp.]
MGQWTKAVLLGLVLASASSQAFSREETWKLTYWPAPWLTEIKATWHMTISDDGKVSGTSTWDASDSSGNPNLSGRSNRIDGHITKAGQLVLVRHLSGKNTGKVQHYKGRYTNGGSGLKGDTTGFNAPGSWVAAVDK